MRPLIQALRPALGDAAFDRFAAEAHGQGLVFTAAYDERGRCAAVATHRVLATSRGRVLFVDHARRMTMSALHFARDVTGP